MSARNGLRVGWLLVVLSLLTGCAAFASGYIITDLGTGTASAINCYGKVVGKDGGPTAITYTAYVWNPQQANGVTGSRQSLGTLTGDTVSVANGINASGMVVGMSRNGSTTSNAFVWTQNGGMDYIGALTGRWNSLACGVNDGGTVVGGARKEYAAPDDSRPFTWSDGSAMQEMPILPKPTLASNEHLWCQMSYAYAVNSAGVAVGTSGADIERYEYHSSYFVGLRKACMWSDTQTVQALAFSGALASADSIAYDINDNGTIVGWSSIGAFIYSQGGGSQLLPFLSNTTRGYAKAVNNSGQVVGYCDNGPERAFIYSNGVLSDLNTLIDPTSGWKLFNANDINDSGQIVGTGFYGGAYHAFLLTPDVPEPASLLVVAMGIVPVLLRRRK